MAILSRRPQDAKEEKKDERAEQKVPATTNASPPAARGFGGKVSDRAMQGEGGAGTSQQRDDNLMPIMYVLQPLSPQCDRQNMGYIRDAEPSMIWLKGAAEQLVRGDEGLIFQPTNFYKEWVEWIPREAGGGIVQKWSLPDGVQTDDEAERFLRKICPDVTQRDNLWFRSNGNVVKFTRVHVGLVHGFDAPMPYVIPLTSTGHSVSKGFMAMMNRKLRPDGRIYDSWACAYLLKTARRQNKKGTWYVLAPEDILDGDGELAGWADDKTLELGRALHEAVVAGTKKAESYDADTDAADRAAEGGGSSSSVSSEEAARAGI